MRLTSFSQRGRLSRTLFGFAALLSSSALMAASPLVASATATISDLSIAIYDFRADDGIAAGASWLSKGNGRAEVVCCDTGSDTYFYGMRSASFSSDRWENTIA